tara:strand:- start:462 stop:632 length:171 start_codon:yes stop_codon:yes gene_type:complete
MNSEKVCDAAEEICDLLGARAALQDTKTKGKLLQILREVEDHGHERGFRAAASPDC